MAWSGSVATVTGGFAIGIASLVKSPLDNPLVDPWPGLGSGPSDLDSGGDSGPLFVGERGMGGAPSTATAEIEVLGVHQRWRAR